MIEFYGDILFKDMVAKIGNPCEVLELGNQIMDLQGNQGISSKEWYTKQLGIMHTSIDINGLNGALKLDLCKAIDLKKQFDLITDFGTIEHTENLYPVFKNIFKHCKVEGYMLHKNPKTGHFPFGQGHNCNFWFSVDFWRELANSTGAEILKLEEYPIYHNPVSGMEVICILQKKKEKFISEEKFNKLLKYIYDK